jgi:hypothetical protein
MTLATEPDIPVLLVPKLSFEHDPMPFSSTFHLDNLLNFI